MKCGYCQQPNQIGGWHSCEYAQRSRRKLARILTGIDELMRGGIEQVDPLDRQAYRIEQNQRDNMRTASRINQDEAKRISLRIEEYNGSH